MKISKEFWMGIAGVFAVALFTIIAKPLWPGHDKGWDIVAYFIIFLITLIAINPGSRK